MSYERAMKAFEIGQWNLASKYLTEELAHDPQRPELYTLLAATELNTGEIQKSIGHAKEAIVLAPNWGFPHYILGLGLTRNKQRIEGAMALEEALSREPFEPMYLTACAQIGYNSNTKAMQMLDRALEAAPTYSPAWHAKYNRLMARNHKRDAEKIRQRILELDPKDAQVHQDLGWETLRQVRPGSNAVEHFETALQVDPMQHKLVAGLQEAHYLANNPVARLFKKICWKRVFAALGLGLVGSGIYFVNCGDDSGRPLVELAALMPILLTAVAIIVYAVGASLYNTGLLIDGWKRGYVQERTRHYFANGVLKSLLCMFAMWGLAGLHLYWHFCKINPLPHWLYSDWENVPGALSYFAILMPVVFVAAIGFFSRAIYRLAKAHIHREPPSAQYFKMWMQLLCSTLGLSCYISLAVVPTASWIFCLIIVAMYACIISQVLQSTRLYANFVKSMLSARAARGN
ncbi:MAG TPA: hypothetical protein V6C81_27485 [Planktothrix sp.]|jgi:tetratricopeptide (TPR) repeat protein